MALVSSQQSSLHALVIGIDEYLHNPAIQNLRGAVHDARSVSDFLKASMHVPERQIEVILNEHATRSRIRKSIEQLANNPNISNGDPILIFYAGHGAQANAPEGWQAGGGPHPRIQMICPYDFLPKHNNTDSAQGIPDMTIAILLNRLSKSKGDNIVCDSLCNISCSEDLKLAHII